MTSFKSEFLNIMHERGFYNQCTNEQGFDEYLADCEKKGMPAVGYLGSDPTGDSQHVGHIVTRGCFPSRNRILSGISDGIIVVEAAQKSGALITADLGMEQGKNIFAIPGNIYSDMSRGCHKIIKEGAKLVENIEDILEEYNNSAFNNNEISIEYDIKSLN